MARLRDALCSQPQNRIDDPFALFCWTDKTLQNLTGAGDTPEYRCKSPITVTAGCAVVWRRTLVIVVQARFATRITHKHGDDHRSRETCQMRGRRNDGAGRRMRR